MPHDETTCYDRYSIELFCQHCGQYLTTVMGVEAAKLPAVRAQLHALAQEHADTVGREVEVTFYTTQERQVWFAPKVLE